MFALTWKVGLGTHRIYYNFKQSTVSLNNQAKHLFSPDSIDYAFSLVVQLYVMNSHGAKLPKLRHNSKPPSVQRTLYILIINQLCMLRNAIK